MNNIQENDHGKNIVDIGAFQDRNQSTAWFLRGFQFENLIVSSHFCSEEGVFLLHRYRGQPHLEKPFLLRTSDLGINHNWSLRQDLQSSFLKKSHFKPPSLVSPVFIFILVPFFVFVFVFISVFVSQKVTARLEPHSSLSLFLSFSCVLVSFFLCLSLFLFLSLSLSLFFKISHLKPPSPVPRDWPSPLQVQQAGTHKMRNYQHLD